MTAMTREEALDRLGEYRAAALAVLSRGTTVLGEGRDALLAQQAELRAALMAALGRYQAFKHEAIFDPAIASPDPDRQAAARVMKAACIGAGETYRAHMQRWSAEAMSQDWPGYAAAARLTANRLRRHIADEAEDVRALIARYGV